MNDNRFRELATLVGIDPDPLADRCPCGCGAATRWRSRTARAAFRPGHDTRLVALLLASARAYGSARLARQPTTGLISINDARQILLHLNLPRLELKLTSLWLGVSRRVAWDTQVTNLLVSEGFTRKVAGDVAVAATPAEYDQFATDPAGFIRTVGCASIDTEERVR